MIQRTAFRLLILSLVVLLPACGKRKGAEPAPKAAPADTAAGLPLLTRRTTGDVPMPITDDLNVLKSLNPEVPATQLNLGDFYLKNGQLKEAIAAYRKSVTLDPKYVQGYNNLGLALARAGDSTGAEAQFRKAIEIDGTFAKAFTNLGAFYVRRGDLQRGLFALQGAVRADSMDPIACSNLGVALKMTGDVNGAILMYQRALKLDPLRAIDHIHIANIYYEKNLWDDAYERYGMALQIDSTLAEPRQFRKVIEESNLLGRNKSR